jgi:Cdc6-like AAA superfamily ATPase
LNGDLRRILQLCKKSVEIFKNKKDPDNIDTIIVLEAWNKLFDSKVIQVLVNLKFYEKLILISLLYELKQSGNNKCGIGKVFNRLPFFLSRIEQDVDYEELCFDEFEMIVFNMIRLTIIEYGDYNNENFINNTLSPKFYVDEFCNAMMKFEDWTKLTEEFVREDEIFS